MNNKILDTKIYEINGYDIAARTERQALDLYLDEYNDDEDEQELIGKIKELENYNVEVGQPLSILENIFSKESLEIIKQIGEDQDYFIINMFEKTWKFELYEGIDEICVSLTFNEIIHSSTMMMNLCSMELPCLIAREGE